MPPTFDPADPRPGQVPLLLAVVHRAMTDRFHDRLTELGREPLRPAHGYTFRYLAAHPGATTVDLAAHLGITKQAASKAVAELQEWGYLRRRPHPTDKRAHQLVLTERGQDYISLADRLWAEVEQQLADIIGPDRLAALSHDLRAYIHHVYGDRPVPFRPVW
ncbi:MarR family winged helix-turn-helix transcriptional regulator [Streptantibioticus cattleyicolor]|uniref:Transcriptional regulator, MarR family n=1 Tax=Streptantibioticus cattleyicolor (strain ATCC 35852 / DSM 46488 / JCM 4925 / NBRC 14057 / NRRL 8057) TaxID=1003195 RepID=F8JLL7_STREN|nr:MarR family winged helix-turn-helix transcriptional regulator [Streptantibioticus cattleyicolor]AEW98252.1 transcriptional regulator, MarR family [Streptantibioticus cattleyicolor NRRL 8057 = DSM 46488]CCB72685.1 putative Transcriptional regulator, MarR family [Streptantibioticus cattleyicolor NRRL 8057 = DSM 46488]